ncbi:MFS transporter [Streptomyces sp. NPDC021218]|uniref:MFS transporter n=1 Tax=Streptomyces sp. NPDC021218 TaxID=3365119 RepID=UPI003793FF04
MKRLSAHIPGLLREQTFRRYWTGQSVSLIGDQISLIAIPLAAVLALNANASEMGWLKTIELLPALLLNLPAGAWADRRADRRRIMIATDLARALLISTLPVAFALDALTLGHLYTIAFAVGALTVLFNVSNTTLFAALLSAEHYVQGNTLINGSRSLAFITGPSAGGVLVQFLTAPFALFANALTYLVSASHLARINPLEPPPAAPRKGHFIAGLRWVLRNPSMRSIFSASATVQFFNFIFQTLFVLYAIDELGLSAGMLGAALGSGAVGGLIGAACTGSVVRRLGIGASVVTGFALFTAPLLLIPLAAGPELLIVAALFAAEFLSCAGVMLVDITVGSLQMALIPDGLRSRVMGAYYTLTHGMRPLGAFAAGLLGTTLGLRPALWIGVAGAILSVLWLLPSPVSRLRELPAPESEDSETVKI